MVCMHEKYIFLSKRLLIAANSKRGGLKEKTQHCYYELKSNNEMKQIFCKQVFKGRFQPGKLWNS